MKEEVSLMKKAKNKKLKKNVNNIERRCIINICKYYKIENNKIAKIIDNFINNNK